jgi:hypothetical protein
MLCIGYAQSAPDEGSASAERTPHPSSLREVTLSHSHKGRGEEGLRANPAGPLTCNCPGDRLNKVLLSEGLCEPRYPFSFSPRQFCVAGGKNDRKLRFLRANFAGEFRAGHAWHYLIGDEEIDTFFAAKYFERLHTGRCTINLMAKLFEQGRCVQRNKRIVIHGQDDKLPL